MQTHARCWSLLLIAAFPAVAVSQATLVVPTAFPTIQAAIVAATNGATVLVLPGTYVENIDFLGKAITVRSANGAVVTTIDGNQAGTVVSFVTNEAASSVLEGFTLTNGRGVTHLGGGIQCVDASPTIRSCSITGNTGRAGIGSGVGGAGGIHAAGSALRLSGCSVLGNTGGAGAAGGPGGAFFAANGTGVVLERCRFANNTGGSGTGPASGRGGAGGIEMFTLATASSFTQCTITGNQGGTGVSGPGGTGGFDVYGPIAFMQPNVAFRNCVVAGNNGGNGSVGGDGGGTATRGIVAFQATSTTIAGNAGGTPTPIAQVTGGLAVGGWQVSSATLVNCILWGNTRSGQPSDIYSNGIATSAGTCDIGAAAGTVFGSGNLSVDPLFVNLAAGDVHLTAASPCRHAGGAFTGLRFDFEGDPRFIGPATDIGADEYEVLPGSREDVTLSVAVNGAFAAAVSPSPAPGGSTVTVNVLSPDASMANGFTLLGLELWVPPAAPAGPPALPELHLSPAASVLLALGGGVSTSGFTLPVTIPPGLAGLAARVQAFVLTAAAENGVFAATAARDVVF